MTKYISQKIQRLFVILMLGSFPLSLHAADFYGATPIVVADLGTEFTTVFSRTINGRLGINALGVDLVQFDGQNTTYNLDFGFNSWSALLDWHPFKGRFRLSGGLLHNEPSDRGQVDPYTGLANVNALSDNELGSLNSIVEFEGTSPYLGIGWGNALTKNGRLGLLVDLGVVFQDDADVNLPSSLGQDASLRNALDDYGYLPVFSLGLSYQFD